MSLGPNKNKHQDLEKFIRKKEGLIISGHKKKERIVDEK